MNGIIIYKTACGSTKQYADWISEETDFSAISLSQAKKLPLKNFDIIIVGSMVIAHKIVISKWLLRHINDINDKKVILFSTSGAKPDEKIKQQFLSRSFPENMAEKLIYFPFHGRRIHKQLSPIAKLMMWIFITFIVKSPDGKKKLREDFDGVDRKYIAPLVEYVRGIDK